MSLDADEEILQDFLIEAGEILEQLSEQLVDLEQSPDDKDLLNAIFRGFHTVKGGSGFLQLTPLVDCCHAAENIFDILRNGQREVNADLMDVVLRALDTVNEMFECVRGGEMPDPADPQLLHDLHALATPESADAAPAPVAEDVSAAETQTSEETVEPTPETVAAEAPAAPESDDITEEEFDALLDQLHGKGKHGIVTEPAPSEPAPAETTPPPAAGGGDDLITESEFEELLDRLHGKGKHSADVTADAPAPESSVAQPVAEPAAPANAAEEKKEAPKKAPTAAKKPDAKKADAKDAPPAAEATVRVDTKRLDDIMNMVGELVLVRNRLVRLGLKSEDEAMSKAVANLDVVTADLQTSVMKTRMQPVKKVFGRFPRVVRDLARQLNKEIKLELHGEDTDLDKNLVEALADPLVHLVRNSVDHGVEMPDAREEKGKPRCGTVVLAAEQAGDNILLTIKDDGAGMDAEALRQKAVEKGIMDADAADRLTETECFNLIFAPGFSTKEQISDVSGRGVGMDVVKTKITQLNGSVTIDSKIDQGTLISIKVPLTLAIMPTLMVMLDDLAFAFPLVNVNEIFHLDLTKTNIVDGQEVVVVREKPIPLFHLKRWLVNGAENSIPEESAHVVVFSVGNQRVGFVVDQLIGQEEVVIKPLGQMLHGTDGLAGATITGDGRIALILDVPSMLNRYASRVLSAA